MSYGPQTSVLPYALKRVLPAVTILLVVGWGIVQHTVVASLKSDVQASLSEHAKSLAGTLSARLAGLLDTAKSLAANDLVVNGVIDTQEADAYLSVMFRSLRIPGSAGAEVYLTDYRGRVIAANTTTHSQMSFWVARVMAGEDIVTVNGLGLFIATPVHYAGSPEGAIVLRYPPRLIPQILTIHGGSDAVTVVDADDNVFFASDDTFLSEGVLWSPWAYRDWMSAEAHVSSPADLRVIAANRTVAALAFVERIDDIMLLAIIAGLMVLTGGIVFTALITTRPLSRLAKEVRQLRPLQESAPGLTQCFATRELNDLASAFNTMLARVRSTTVSRDHYEAILNSMNELVIVTDAGGAIVDANQVAVDNIGLPRAALIRAACSRFFRVTSAGGEAPAADLNPTQAASQHTIEAECMTGEQRRFPVLITVSRMHTPVGLRYLIVALDVSELHTTRKMLEHAIESIEDGFAMYDADDRLVVCNTRYRSLFSVIRDKIVAGVRFEDVVRFGLELGQYADAVGCEEAWLAKRMAAHRNPSGPVIQHLHDGRWVMIRERVMDDGSTVGIRTDITQLKHQQQALQKSNAELESFAYVASHDLQEPLRKIQAFGGRLQEHYAQQLDARGQDYLRRMIDASGRMSRLIADLLEFSRLATREREFTALDLDDVLRDVISDLELAIEECGARVEGSHLPVIKGDYTQMRQVFQNLIGNALKFRRPDVAPVVIVSAQPAPGDTWRITVQDNGIGFEDQYAARIFEIFQRLHGRSEYTGTGIGLAVVRKIVELHGGTIEAQGDKESGATFTIELRGQAKAAGKFDAEQASEALAV